MVQSVKQSLETSLMEDNGLTLSQRVANLYRNAPRTTTCHTPAELFHDGKRNKTRSFEPGDAVKEEAHGDIDIHVPVNPPPVSQEVPAIPPPMQNAQNDGPPLRRNPPRNCGAPAKLDL